MNHDAESGRLAGDLFTDGVVEAVNTSGQEFGETRLLQAAAASGQAVTARVMQRIMTSIDVFVGNTRSTTT